MSIVGWFFPLGQSLPATLLLQMDISSWTRYSESQMSRTQPGSVTRPEDEKKSGDSSRITLEKSVFLSKHVPQ